MKLVFIAVLLSAATGEVKSFVTLPQDASARFPSQLAAGRGMGMAASAKTKGKDKSKKANGMGKKNGAAGNSGSSGSFDVNASMLRLEKKYDELLLAAAKRMAKEDEDPRLVNNDDGSEDKITSEYVVAARAISKMGGVKDWIPFAQICLTRPESEYDNSKDVVQAAISTYCRELSHIAVFGAPVFSSVARNDLQYGIEPIDSFHKHVYDSVIEGTVEQDMTKSAAREALGLQKDETDKGIIKQAYRRLSFELHPDRFEGSPEERNAASERFARVKLAYETLSSGVRQEGVSWYESLGGRARTEFLGPISLLPMATAQEQMTRRKAEGAIVGLEKDLIQTFVARNLRSSS